VDESDEIERWLAKDFDDPAAEAIERVVGGLGMTKTHWKNLARFFGAQYVRTPAHYLKTQQHWKVAGGKLFDETMEELHQELAGVHEGPIVEADKPTIENKMFPINTSIEPSDQPGMSLLSVEVSVGRKFWLWSLRHALRANGPIELLERHRWTILDAPEGRSWLTSDNPAIQLGLARDGTRNLSGGWSSPRTVLMLPLSPQHMLYTEIGERSPEKYTVVDELKFSEMNRIIAGNAFRSIYSSYEDLGVPRLRPRHVSEEAFRNEKQQWTEWHSHHSDAERFKK
jgi:hypothetical protein